jgi:hypothetical protein
VNEGLYHIRVNFGDFIAYKLSVLGGFSESGKSLYKSVVSRARFLNLPHNNKACESAKGVYRADSLYQTVAAFVNYTVSGSYGFFASLRIAGNALFVFV